MVVSATFVEADDPPVGQVRQLRVPDPTRVSFEQFTSPIRRDVRPGAVVEIDLLAERRRALMGAGG